MRHARVVSPLLRLAAARGQLDETHLDRWALERGVADLLDRAREEVADL